jgi:hypothetical protein
MCKKLFIILCTFIFTITAEGKSYSSSKSHSSSFSSKPSSSKSYSSSSSSKSYSSSSKPASSGTTKSSFSFFKRAEKAQVKENSRASLDKYKASQQSYEYLKQQPKEVYSTRTTRQQNTFQGYYKAQPPTVVYRDTSWNPFFWMWLLDHSANQAEWVYHHKDQISDERYKELLAKNKDLEAQVKALDDKKIAKDPNFAPSGVDKDLMYSDDYVKDVQKKDSGSGLLWLLLLIPIIGAGVWFVFFRKVF